MRQVFFLIGNFKGMCKADRSYTYESITISIEQNQDMSFNFTDLSMNSPCELLLRTVDAIF